LEPHYERKMFKYFTANNTNKYIDVLDDFVERYNNTRHSSVKMTPVEASKKENEVRAYRNLYQDFERRPIHAKLKIGDKVGIQKKKGLFENVFTSNWTEDVFTVSKIQITDPIAYKITDYNDEEVQGTFYEQELQKTSQEVYRIEEVVKKGKTKSLVICMGIQKLSTLRLTTKILMSNEEQSLGINSSTVTVFLNDKLTPEQCKELQKIMNLDPKLYRKVYIYQG